LKFFFDNTMPPTLVVAVRELVKANTTGHELKHLSDRFRRDIPDIDWIRGLSVEGGWTIISGDVRISRNRAEREVWLESNMLGFFLAKGWTNLTLWDQAWRFIRIWPKVMRLAETIKPPAGFIIHASSLKFDQLRI
jgi:hypothetical protein